ncbi:MAG TPA: hypothetical protein VET48_02970, partial [Steroidobacteraceae bacterium]|nr:hypothetical protein [Steroidobacteraceae bacterium]
MTLIDCINSQINANVAETKQMARENLMVKVSKNISRLGALLAMVCAATAAHAVSYDITTVSRPGAFLTQLFDINNAGQAVGFSSDSLNGNNSAFIYSSGTFTALTGPAGAVSTSALGISDGGIVVGDFSTTTLGPTQSFIYSGGTYTTFAIAGATDTFARGVSPDGRYISGYYDNGTVSGQGFILDTLTNTVTFVGDGGTDNFTIAQGINSSYVLVGSDIISSTTPSTRPGFIYDIGTATRTDVLLPGTTRTTFRAIDDNGIISGWYVSGGIDHGFSGYPGSLDTIDVIGADGTFIEGSNNARVLVGN